MKITFLFFFFCSSRRFFASLSCSNFLANSLVKPLTATPFTAAPPSPPFHQRCAVRAGDPRSGAGPRSADRSRPSLGIDSAAAVTARQVRIDDLFNWRYSPVEQVIAPCSAGRLVGRCAAHRMQIGRPHRGRGQRPGSGVRVIEAARRGGATQDAGFMLVAGVP